MVIVAVAKGKGYGKADCIMIKPFESTEEAYKYIDSISDINTKYWTAGQIIEFGQEISPYKSDSTTVEF